jgi:very-short-patch-repair endonuclease
MCPQSRKAPEKVLAEIASRSHGVVTRSELLAAGLTAAQVRHRVRRGVLIRVHPGVYRVGHVAPSVEARYTGAVKACGEGAALSGRAAAHLLGLLRGSPPPPEVTTHGWRRVKGVITHIRHLPPDEVTTSRGIPVTTVTRTLVDLAGLIPLNPLNRACHEAGVRYGTDPTDVDALLERHPTAAGRRALRRVLHGEEPVTLSALERRFLLRLRRARLPLPEVNRVAGGRVVDCRWPQSRLTVELDGYRYHRSRHSWERDREREREARARGDEFRYRDVFEDPGWMLSELRGLLGHPSLSSRKRSA